ncbi:MAG: hypothetical protein GY757_05315 [bacterium]|nr:hypothetical protein [bacterium]
MPENIAITIRNEFVVEKRDLNIFHNSARSAYLLSYSSFVTLSLGTIEDGDYLHLSIVRGPGNLERECVLDMPSWCNFEVSFGGDGSIVHHGKRTWLRIPGGPPVWQLRLTWSPGEFSTQKGDYISIGDGDFNPHDKLINH